MMKSDVLYVWGTSHTTARNAHVVPRWKASGDKAACGARGRMRDDHWYKVVASRLEDVPSNACQRCKSLAVMAGMQGVL